ncbi:unnamed protein product [Victoria cruziana]
MASAHCKMNIVGHGWGPFTTLTRILGHRWKFHSCCCFVTAASVACKSKHWKLISYSASSVLDYQKIQKPTVGLVTFFGFPVFPFAC